MCYAVKATCSVVKAKDSVVKAKDSVVKAKDSVFKAVGRPSLVSAQAGRPSHLSLQSGNLLSEKQLLPCFLLHLHLRCDVLHPAIHGCGGGGRNAKQECFGVHEGNVPSFPLIHLQLCGDALYLAIRGCRGGGG